MSTGLRDRANLCHLEPLGRGHYAEFTTLSVLKEGPLILTVPSPSIREPGLEKVRRAPSRFVGMRGQWSPDYM